MSEPLQPGLFIDGRGRICELREVGGTWQHPSTTTEPQCLTYPPERLIPESQVRAQVEAARQDEANDLTRDDVKQLIRAARLEVQPNGGYGYTDGQLADAILPLLRDRDGVSS